MSNDEEQPTSGARAGDDDDDDDDLTGTSDTSDYDEQSDEETSNSEDRSDIQDKSGIRADELTDPSKTSSDVPESSSVPETTASFSMAQALNMVRLRREEQQRVAKQKELELEEQRLEKAREKRRRRRRNQKLRKAKLKLEEDVGAADPVASNHLNTELIKPDILILKDESSQPISDKPSASVSNELKRKTTTDGSGEVDGAVLKRVPKNKRIKLGDAKQAGAGLKPTKRNDNDSKNPTKQTAEAPMPPTGVNMVANGSTRSAQAAIKFIPRALLLKASKAKNAS